MKLPMLKSSFWRKIKLTISSYCGSKNNRIIKLTILAIFAFSMIFESCGKPQIKITKDYILNTGWSAGRFDGLDIYRLLLKDSTLSFNDRDFHATNIRDGIRDTIECFFMADDKNFNTERIYFDREQNYVLWINCKNSEVDRRKILGTLSINSWYAFRHIQSTLDYYVYIDSLGGAHVYSDNPVNW